MKRVVSMFSSVLILNRLSVRPSRRSSNNVVKSKIERESERNVAFRIDVKRFTKRRIKSISPAIGTRRFRFKFSDRKSSFRSSMSNGTRRSGARGCCSSLSYVDEEAQAVLSERFASGTSKSSQFTVDYAGDFAFVRRTRLGNADHSADEELQSHGDVERSRRREFVAFSGTFSSLGRSARADRRFARVVVQTDRIDHSHARMVVAESAIETLRR